MYPWAVDRAALVLVLLPAVLTASAVGTKAAELTSPSSSLSQRAMGLLHDQCVACHNPEKKKGGLTMDSREALLKGGDDGPVVDLAAPENSRLLQALQPDADPHMPPKKQLPASQIDLVHRWVTNGVPWDEVALRGEKKERSVNLEPLPPRYRPSLALALSPDGRWLAIGRGAEVFIHDTHRPNFPEMAHFKAHPDAVRALAWSPNGQALASGAFREITLWTTNGFKAVWTVRAGLVGRVTALRFSTYGGALVAADSVMAEAGWVRLFNVDSGQPTTAWLAHRDSIHDLAVSPDGGVLATAGGDKLAKLWEAVSQREIGHLEGHAGAVTGVAFNTNGTELLTVSADKQLKIWNLRTRESTLSLSGRKHGFDAAAWSADGRVVVTADDDGQLCSFSSFKEHTGEQSSATADEGPLGHWSEPLHAVAVSPDGQRAFASGEDGVAYAVDAKGHLLATFRSAEAEEKVEAPPSGLMVGPSFVSDVLPMLSKAGCSAGPCHAKPEGQNGFKLSVFNSDPAADFNQIVKSGRGRRVFPAAPDESLLLLKPTMAIEHGGGQRIEPGSTEYQLLIAWIRAGMIYERTNEPALVQIVVAPHQKSYKKGATQQLRVIAKYQDSSSRDVTSLTHFVASDKEMANVDDSGLVRLGQVSGESAVIARFMGLVDAARVTVPADELLSEEKYAALPRNNFIDDLAWEHFRKLGLFPSEGCTDAEFFRRSTLDTIGELPSAEEARAFLADPDPGKRRRWVDFLLQRPAYADYWANKWADLLRPNPDRVGVKSAYVLDQWLRESFRENKPYDQFVSEILLAEGNNHRDGPVVIYRDRREPTELTTMFSQLFLGVRLECARCHHHPNEKWSMDDFYQFAAFFGPLKQKGAGLSPPISAGNETFYFGPGGTVKHPLTDKVLKPRPLDGTPVHDDQTDPRHALAEWLTNPANPFFAKAAVNRVWANFFGRGFVEPVDDFRISNPVVNEPLLDALARDFVEHRYDLKHLIRTILDSRLYQLSSIPNTYNLADTKNFSRSLRRRLPAEVLLDAVDDVTGVPDNFNGLPPGARAMQAWSYKISSHFLDTFGRPNSSSDCPCERDVRPSVVQSLHMMNAKNLQSKLANHDGRVAQLAASGRAPDQIVSDLYYAALNRPPTDRELEKAVEIFARREATRQTATEDVLWALLNSAEFVFNH